MFNFFSRPLALTLGGISFIGVIAFTLYASFSSSASPTTNNQIPATNTSTPTTQPSNTPTARPSNTPQPTNTFTPQPTSTFTKIPATNTQPPANTPTFTPSPSSISYLPNGFGDWVNDANGLRIRFSPFDSSANKFIERDYKVGDTFTYKGHTFTISSDAAKDAVWVQFMDGKKLTEADMLALGLQKPPTATPVKSTGGGSGTGTGTGSGGTTTTGSCPTGYVGVPPDCVKDVDP